MIKISRLIISQYSPFFLFFSALHVKVIDSAVPVELLTAIYASCRGSAEDEEQNVEGGL